MVKVHVTPSRFLAWQFNAAAFPHVKLVLLSMMEGLLEWHHLAANVAHFVGLFERLTKAK